MENLLKIGKLCMCYISTFTIPGIDPKTNPVYIPTVSAAIKNDLTGKTIRSRLCNITENPNKNNDFIEDYLCPNLPEKDERASCSCFNRTDHFLKEPLLDKPFYCERFRLHRIRIEDDLTVDLILAVYYNIMSANLLVNVYTEKEQSVDDILYIDQKMNEQSSMTSKFDYDNFKSIVENTRDNEYHSIALKSFCTDYATYIQYFISRLTDQNKIRLISQQVLEENFYDKKHIYRQRIIEIRNISLKEEVRPNDTLIECSMKYHPEELYGLLTGDEGWRFVPKKVARARLAHNWGTRSFTKCIAFGNNIVTFNLKDQAYIKSQEQICQKMHNLDKLPYFKMYPCIAGLDHGILEAVEKATVLKVILRASMSNLDKIDTQNKQSNTIRKIDYINHQRAIVMKLLTQSYISTKELDDLADIIYKEKGIFSDINDLKYKLELYTQNLSFLYQRNENQILLLLTVITVLAAFVVGFFSLNQNITNVFPSPAIHYFRLTSVFIFITAIILFRKSSYYVLLHRKIKTITHSATQFKPNDYSIDE